MELIKRDCVKELLIINHLTQDWLRYMLLDQCSVKTTKSEMTRILSGELTTHKAQVALDNALLILRSYNQWANTKIN